MSLPLLLIGAAAVVGGSIGAFKTFSMEVSVVAADYSSRIINNGLVAERALLMDASLCLVLVGALLFCAGWITAVMQDKK